jgi:hypothetical protein
MFATPTSYCVTPSRKPFMRIPERASTFLRDVKRRSLRVKRSKSLIERHPECKLSGKKWKKIFKFYVVYIQLLFYVPLCCTAFKISCFFPISNNKKICLNFFSLYLTLRRRLSNNRRGFHYMDYVKKATC